MKKTVTNKSYIYIYTKTSNASVCFPSFLSQCLFFFSKRRAVLLSFQDLVCDGFNFQVESIGATSSGAFSEPWCCGQKWNIETTWITMIYISLSLYIYNIRISYMYVILSWFYTFLCIFVFSNLLYVSTFWLRSVDSCPFLSVTHRWIKEIATVGSRGEPILSSDPFPMWFAWTQSAMFIFFFPRMGELGGRLWLCWRPRNPRDSAFFSVICFCDCGLYRQLFRWKGDTDD